MGKFALAGGFVAALALSIQHDGFAHVHAEAAGISVMFLVAVLAFRAHGHTRPARSECERIAEAARREGEAGLREVLDDIPDFSRIEGGKPPVSDVRPADPLRVLVAEDNEVNQDLVVQILEKHGHIVTVVGDGDAAVRKVAIGGFDLVLMDVQMPGVDGTEATRRIRRAEADGERIPIVALTAHAMHGDAERFLAAGMDSYVSKPFRVDELMRVVESMGWGIPPPIDRRDVMERVGGDERIFREVAATFCRELPKQLGAIRSAIEAADPEGLERTAHSLKGACAAVGAKAAARLASTLEETGAGGTLNGSGPVFAILQSELNAAATMLEAEA